LVLSQTVDGALKVSRDAALAASDDNIQTLALFSCERFGATLAISSFRQRKIEAMVRKQAVSPVQKFLLAKIGYAKGGSIDALSKSAEGIPFLSLASALVSASNNFDAATALAKMVRDTAEDKALSPTVYQLKDLLDVLEPRLNRARFLDEVAGYQALILRSQNQAGTANIAVPSPEAIQTIVESFRELYRLGNADARSLKFAVGPFAAWVSAFARWSIEVPPLICDDQSQAIVDQPDSKVTICISRDAKYEKNIEIETVYGYDSIRKVVSAIVGNESKPALATGMVSLETHASLSLKELDFNNGLGSRACVQALPYALHLVRSTFGRANGLNTFSFQSYEASKVSMLRILNPFPDEEVVADVMKTYLGLNHEISLQRLEDGLNIGDLPLVRLWTEEHKSFLEAKLEDEFFRRLSHVVVDILALSLVVAEKSINLTKNDILMLYIPNRALSPVFAFGSEWQTHIEAMLQAPEALNSFQVFQIEPGFKWALKLVGHDVSNDVNSLDWVEFSFRGQVFLPRILLADEIPLSGFACLSYFPGTLMLETQKDRQFSRILSKGPSFEVTKLDKPGWITAQLNAYPREAVKWQLASKAEHLELSMGWTLNKKNHRPMNLLTALLGSVMMGPCRHSADAEMLPRDIFVFIAPGSNRLLAGNSIRDQKIAIYPLYGNEELRMLTLASTTWMRKSVTFINPIALINRGACINCVLDIGVLIECDYVIL
jgi:hypothetical protein